MFVFGGRSSTSGTYYHDVYKSTDGNTWTQINDAPWSGRAFMGYTTAGNTIWFVGGYDGSSNVADVYKATYNSTTGNLTWTQTTSNTGAGARHAAALLDYNGYLYLLSGWSGVNSVYKSADTDGASWALVTSSPPFATQTWGSAVVFNGKMWVMNGKSSESYPSGFPSTVYYSTDGVTWTLATTGSWAGRYCSPVVVDSTHNIMYMLGGGYWINTGPSAYYNDTWYTTDGTNWAEMSANSAFTARGYDPGIYFNGNMYLIGGDIASGIVGDVWTTAQMTPILTWSNPINITYGTALNATQLNADSGGIAGSFVYTPASGTVLDVGNAQNLNVVFTPIDLGNYSSITQNVSINVSQASTSIVWANPSNITYGTALSGTQLNATGSVAGTVTYNVSVGNILSAGTHTLHADFAPTDTTNYTSNSKNVTLNVTQVTPTISWTQPSAINYGVALNSSQLSATTSTPGTFVYNPVSGTVLSAGTQTLSTTFTPTDGANYTTNTASVSLTVNKIAPVITWNTPASIPYGTALSSTQLSATCPQTGLFVYNPASGTVLSGGSHTLNTTFTPSGADATNYTTNTTSVTLVVDHFTPTITWSNPANITYGTALSGTQLNADSGGIAGTFTYTPASGTVLGVGTGQTLHVDYTPTDSANYTGSSKDVSINVSKATSIVTWSTPSPITYGTALSGTQLNAACATTAGTFVYSPVSGTVLSAGSQTLSVIFTPTDSTNYTINSTVNVTLTVNKAPTTIAWNNPANITYGTSLNGTQLNASPSVGGTLTYSPISGTVMHAGDGQNLHVDLTPTDSTNYSTSSKDVSINVTKITSVITWSNPADIINPAALSSAQLNAACATTAGSFAYSPASGVVLSPGNGQTLSTTFTPTDATNYTTVTASATINVKNAIPSASFTENLTSGTVPLTVQFNDTSTGANISAWLWQWGDGTANSTVRNAIHTFTSAGTYIVNLTVTNDGGSSESSNTNISPGKTTPTITWSNPSAITYGIALSATQLNASAGVAGTYTYTPANGTVLEAGSQNLHVDFNPTDTTNYTSASKDVSITVNKVSTGVTWTTPSPITYGTALSATQLNATNNISLAGSYAYSPVNGAVLSAGTQTLNVTFTPTDASNYTGCSGSVNLIVNKAIPVITWHDPDEIVHGTPLSSTQLAASASVSGNFVYDPTTGTILAVGGHTLNTTFTPDDLVNYTAVSASVHINVVTGSSSNPPVTSFTVNVTSGEVPLVVHFIDNTTGQTSEVLDFGDNTSTSNTANVVHTYSNVGTYHATLTASNAHGESSATITINVTNATSAPDEPQTFHITRKAPTSSDNLVTAKSNDA